jgi:hypothetical protein
VGLFGDTYDVHVDKDIPTGWGGTICANGICYPPFINDITISIGGGEQDTVYVDMQPVTFEGSASMTITVTSQADPTQTWSQTYKIITSGVPILSVDDDRGADYETYFEDALGPALFTYGTWNLEEHGKLEYEQLQDFQGVIWNCGLGEPTLDAEDRLALGSYLDNGGNLFLSGQNIGWDFFAVGGTQNDPAAQSWYQTYLGADYVSDDANDVTLSGVLGDPISDGLDITIAGGDGANNQDSPDEIEPTGGGQTIFRYAADQEAAVRLDGGAFQSVYLGFGFEGIGDDAHRDLLMQRVLYWFGVTEVAVGEDTIERPFLATTPTASPNPFNPATNIEFRVGGSQPAPVAVDIFDARGRKVRTLFSGAMPPGDQLIQWDGRSDSGQPAASGVYLARIRVDEDQQSLKMTLAK